MHKKAREKSPPQGAHEPWLWFTLTFDKKSTTTLLNASHVWKKYSCPFTRIRFPQQYGESSRGLASSKSPNDGFGQVPLRMRFKAPPSRKPAPSNGLLISQVLQQFWFPLSYIYQSITFQYIYIKHLLWHYLNIYSEILSNLKIDGVDANWH